MDSKEFEPIVRKSVEDWIKAGNILSSHCFGIIRGETLKHDTVSIRSTGKFKNLMVCCPIGTMIKEGDENTYPDIIDQYDFFAKYIDLTADQVEDFATGFDEDKVEKETEFYLLGKKIKEEFRKFTVVSK